MTRQRDGRPWREWVARGGLIVASLVAAGAVLEILLRAFTGLLPAEVQVIVGATPGKFGVADPYIGHLHKPDTAIVLPSRDFRATHHTDRRGFRNRGPWPERADIVAVGDSLTFGYGVEDHQTWPALVARALPQARVINLGLVGAGPQQYLRLHEVFGIPLRPRVLLVGVFAQNDFWDAGLFDRWARSETGWNYMVWRDFGRPGRVEAGQRLLGGVKTAVAWNAYLLSRHLYLFNLLRQSKSIVAGRRAETLTVEFRDGSRVRLQPEEFAAKTRGARPDQPEYRLVLEALQRLYQLAADHDTRVLMVLQPSKEEVYLPVIGQSAPDVAAPLREAFARSGIDYIDLLPVFHERAAAGQRLFFEFDGHPNAVGYALIADTVVRHLQTPEYVSWLERQGPRSLRPLDELSWPISAGRREPEPLVASVGEGG